MKKRNQPTYYAKEKEVVKNWVVFDAKDQILGRLATQVADALRGKNKPTFTPSVDCGDFVVVINAGKIKVSGKKSLQKNYYRHSGYPGGLKTTSYKEQMEKDPTKIIMAAVKGMLPHNSLGAQQLTKLKVYAEDSHPHEAQLNTTAPKVEAKDSKNETPSKNKTANKASKKDGVENKEPENKSAEQSTNKVAEKAAPKKTEGSKTEKKTSDQQEKGEA